MADLRIVDAPLLSTVKGTEKIPTGGEGNFSISVNQVADFAKLKWVLATEEYVNNAVGNVQADLNLHKNNESNPHNVTKTQVGLGNVDNTADLDKPVSNATQSAIITANSGKADKTYVDSQDLALQTQINQKATAEYLDNALTEQTQTVNTALSNLSTAANRFYPTLAAANADIANIAVNQPVNIGEVASGGLWYKATAGATSLTKSPYDPLTQANNYTELSLSNKITGVLTKNLANPGDYVVGYTINNNGGGVLVNANYTITGYIPVYSGSTYTVSSKYSCAWYDKNKVFISGNNDSIKTLTAPNNAAFFRMGLHYSVVSTFQMEIGSSSTAFEHYHDTYLKNTAIPDGFISTAMILDQAVTPKKSNFLQPSKNLFNKTTVTSNTLIATNGNFVDNATYSTSDFIKVLPNTNYIGVGGNETRSYCFFNANKVAIGGSQAATGATFISPENSAFVRVSCWSSDLNAYQFELGSVKTSYAQFGYSLALVDGTPISTSASIESKWKDKTWASLGDSITQGAAWQGYVNAVHKLNWTNYGIGGSKISGAVGDTSAMCQDARINAIPTTVNLVTLMGGTNDWSTSVPIGNIDSADPLTFYGALNTFVQKAYTRWPSNRICIATTPYGDRPDWATPTKNSLGLTINDYAEAIRLICKKHNICCIDVNSLAGGNSYNITTWIGGSTTDHFHPAANSDAAKGIGISHISVLNQIAPVA